MNDENFLKELGLNESNEGTSTGQNWIASSGTVIRSPFSPVDGKKIGEVQGSSSDNYEDSCVAKAQKAFEEWRMWPAPHARGELCAK